MDPVSQWPPVSPTTESVSDWSFLAFTCTLYVENIDWSMISDLIIRRVP